MSPVRLVKSDSMPALNSVFDQLGQRYTLALSSALSQQPSGDQQFHKTVDIGVFREQGPVEPANFIVLTIGIVVAVLGSPALVAHQKHWKAKRENRDSQEILDLAIPQFLNGRVVARALDTAVPTPIVIGAIAVILAVGLVVLIVVRSQVVQRESVVTCYEVHALFRLAFFMAVDFVASKDPVSEVLQRAVLGTEEASNVIAKATIPLFPAVSYKTADLIQPSCIPGLSNHLCACENRI